MSGHQQYGDWYGRPPFVPAPFTFGAPMHDFSRPPPSFPPHRHQSSRPPAQFYNQPRQVQLPPPDKILKNEDQEWVDHWLRSKNISESPNPGSVAAGTLNVKY